MYQVQFIRLKEGTASAYTYFLKTDFLRCKNAIELWLSDSQFNCIHASWEICFQSIIGNAVSWNIERVKEVFPERVVKKSGKNVVWAKSL